VFQQLADERAGARRGIEDFHVPVDEVTAKMPFGEPVGAFDHEPHDLVGRVDDAQPIRSLDVVDLVEILVDDLEKGLLLVVTFDVRRGGADCRVIRLEAFERAVFGVAREERRFELVEFPRDVVVLVERPAREHRREDFLGQDVLDQHFPHVGLDETRIDGLLRVPEKRLGSTAECRIVGMRPLDHRAQRLQD
jgi:hypothetical protein